MSFPSVGCQTCKIRRIKCDGIKPTCRRCAKSRRFCLDMSAAPQANLLIHVENCYASGETKRPRGPRSSLTLHRPHSDLQSRALAYYLNYHLQTLTDAPHVLGCLSESVSAWRASGRSCDMVDLALSSTALAVFSRTQNHPPALEEASTRYYHLLRLARRRVAQLGISDCSEEELDACLLTSLLMGRYEGTIHYSTDPNSLGPLMSPNSWSHHEGAMAILKVWNDRLGLRPPTRIIKDSRRGLIRFSILGDLPLPDWILDGKSFGEHDLELDYDRITTQVFQLRTTLTKLQGKSFIHFEKVKELDRKALKLDKAWQEWAVQCPSTWSYQQHKLAEPGPWPKKHFYSSTVFKYTRLGYAALWCQYFAARMLINSTRLKALAMLHDTKSDIDLYCGQQRLECTMHLEAMADSLASTIPFCLERLKIYDGDSSTQSTSHTFLTTEEIKPYLATWTIWPLATASSIQEISANQRLWFRSELVTVGRVLGDGVLSHADSAQWATL